MPGAGHMVMLEQPAAVARTVAHSCQLSPLIVKDNKLGIDNANLSARLSLHRLHIAAHNVLYPQRSSVTAGIARLWSRWSARFSFYLERADVHREPRHAAARRQPLTRPPDRVRLL